MTTTMKGLLKGLRYISQIFEADDEEDEPEMQIGHPTDVKHLAHIGLDGPSSNSPSWMNGFQPDKNPADTKRTPPNNSSDASKASRRYPSMESISPEGGENNNEDPKSRRRHSAGGAFLNSPGLGSPDGNKASRRSQNSHAGGDSSEGGPNVPKHSKKKKSSKGSSSRSGGGDGSVKGSSSGGSVRGERTSKSRTKPQQTVGDFDGSGSGF